LIYRILSYGLLLALLATVHIASVGILTEKNTAFLKTNQQEQISALPAPLLRILAFDYKGIVSDALFIKGIVYIGGFLVQKNHPVERVRLSDSQWRAFLHVMDASTELDPYFQDPYYFANAFLTWDAGMIKEANAFLDKGSRYRHWDWSLPFFAGFNYFYFLQDNDKASEKLMEASRRNNKNLLLASLASKLAFKENKTENSILFLEEMINKTEDEQTREKLKTRLDAFNAILTLEKAVEAYQQKFGRMPEQIDELVKKNILAEIPQDPYGGEYFIDERGQVRTTSETKNLPVQNRQFH